MGQQQRKMKRTGKLGGMFPGSPGVLQPKAPSHLQSSVDTGRGPGRASSESPARNYWTWKLPCTQVGTSGRLQTDFRRLVGPDIFHRISIIFTLHHQFNRAYLTVVKVWWGWMPACGLHGETPHLNALQGALSHGARGCSGIGRQHADCMVSQFHRYARPK